MNHEVFIRCPSCVAWPKATCSDCWGIGGWYQSVEELTEEQESANQEHIRKIKSDLKKANKQQFLVNKLKVYFHESIEFLDQYSHIHEIIGLIADIRGMIDKKFYIQLKNELLNLNTKKIALEISEVPGSMIRVSGSQVSIIKADSLIKIKLLASPKACIIPVLRLAEIRSSVEKRAKYYLNSKLEAFLMDVSFGQVFLCMDELAVVRFNIHGKVDCYYLLGEDFDNLVLSL